MDFLYIVTEEGKNTAIHLNKDAASKLLPRNQNQFVPPSLAHFDTHEITRMDSFLTLRRRRRLPAFV